MKNSTVISVKNLSKIYKLYNEPIDRLKEAFNPFKKIYHKDFYALKDISFNIQKGEVIGILGKNGSGKSTLLKLITGVLTSSSGSIELNGKVTAMLELGAGFNPELTGLENIYFNGSIMGHSKSDMDQKLDEIISFADIGDFINQPVKMYSSGMKARLGFAVSINIDPEILIIDEVLSVGDIYFKQKSIRKMKEFMNSDKTILFVTHDLGAIKNFCTRVLWINEGKLIAEGKPEEMVKQYTSFMTYGLKTTKDINVKNKIESKVDKKNNLIWKNVLEHDSFGKQGARITDVTLYEKKSNEKIVLLQGGEEVSFYIKAEVYSEIFSPGIGLVLKDKLGNQIFGINNYIYDFDLKQISKNETLIFEICFRFPHIKNGDYIFTVAISDGTQEEHIQHHWIHDAYHIKVANPEMPYHRSSLLILDKNKIDIKRY